MAMNALFVASLHMLVVGGTADVTNNLLFMIVSQSLCRHKHTHVSSKTLELASDMGAIGEKIERNQHVCSCTICSCSLLSTCPCSKILISLVLRFQKATP